MPVNISTNFSRNERLIRVAGKVCVLYEYENGAGFTLCGKTVIGDDVFRGQPGDKKIQHKCRQCMERVKYMRSRRDGGYE